MHTGPRLPQAPYYRCVISCPLHWGSPEGPQFAAQRQKRPFQNGFGASFYPSLLSTGSHVLVGGVSFFRTWRGASSYHRRQRLLLTEVEEAECPYFVRSLCIPAPMRPPDPRRCGFRSSVGRRGRTLWRRSVGKRLIRNLCEMYT